MAKNGWKLSKVAITGSTRSLLAKNGRKWVWANQIRPTTLSAAIVFRYTRSWPKKHRELPFLAVALIFIYLSVDFIFTNTRADLAFFASAQSTGLTDRVLKICFCWLCPRLYTPI